jgi:ADP-heptose:LPS heptosyltransferase
MMKIFVYRPGAIGDTILTLPALAALRARFPGSVITYAGNAAMRPLLPVEQALTADDPLLLPLFDEPARPWPEADVQVVFARQPIGLPGIQCDPLEAVSRGVHVVDWLVEAIDPAFHDRIPRLQVPPQEGARLVIHPGAGSRAKRWPAERFCQLAHELGLPLAVVTGPAEPDIDIPVPHQRWQNLPLPELARKLAGSRLFVGNDSGISHLAAALGVPVVAIYVSTDPTIWGVRGARSRIIAGDVSVPEALQKCRELLP